MASPAEYLTKQLNIKKEIVTFRCLSRALAIHVNVAKKELASYHASSKSTDEPTHATYLLTGNVAPVNAYGSYRDEMEVEVDEDELETVSTTKIVLVGENELEAAKAQFTRPPSVHIYSLSPAAIRDAALLVPAAEYVRSQYISKGIDFHQSVGLVVGADVKVRAFAAKKGKSNGASSSKLQAPLPEKRPMDKPASSEKNDKVKEKPKDMKKGTLDWSKAKSKTEKEKDANAAKDAAKAAKEKDKEKAAVKKVTEQVKQKVVSKKESKVALNQGQSSKKAIKMESEESDVDVKKKIPEKPKRGTKRASGVMSLSDSEEDEPDRNPAPKTKPRTSASPLPSKPAAAASDKGVKVKRGVLISDDEDETSGMKPKPLRRNGKGKSRASLSDDEDDPDRSVKAMMDLDDSHFVRHNKTSVGPQPKEDEEEDEEMLSDSEPTPARAKPKRKPKKVVPMGSNGLPKKRIVKSRKSKDARGYMITQDYSSYETASESEQAPAALKGDNKSKTGKGTQKKEDDASPRSTSEKVSSSQARPKPRNSTKPTPEGDESSIESTKTTKANGEAKSGPKKTGSSFGGGSKSNGEKPSNGSKTSLMNYFGKK